MGKNEGLMMTARILLIVGGLNWGLSIFGVNLVEFLPWPMLQTIIYGAIGIAAIVEIYNMAQ